MKVSLIISIIINFILLVIISTLYKKEPTYITKEIIKKDTIVEYLYSTDTIKVNETKFVYETKTINDTVYINNIPINYKFNDDRYSLDINAVRLVNYKLDIHYKDTFTIYKEIIKPTYITNKKRFTWNLGIYGGYSPIYNKPDLIIGGGFGFNF